MVNWIQHVSLFLLAWLVSWPRGAVFDSLAAEAMFRLNRVAAASDRYRSSKKDRIYELKNDFIHALYQAGYCTSVTVALQHMPCWGTNRRECGPHCPKCDGTGIYRTHRLFHFRFVVDGRHYNWHQPAGLVKWQFTLSSPNEEEYRPEGYERPKLEGNLLFDYFFLYWWLHHRGYYPVHPNRLFRMFGFSFWRSEEFYGRPGRLTIPFAQLDWNQWPRSIYFQFPVIWNWKPFGVAESYWGPKWVALDWHDGKLKLVLFGRDVKHEVRHLYHRLLCWLTGHEEPGGWSLHICPRCGARRSDALVRVGLCVNDEHGRPTGKIDRIDFEMFDEMFGDIINLYAVDEEGCSFERKGKSIVLNGRAFPIVNYGEWAGNVFWDSALVTVGTAADLLNALSDMVGGKPGHYYHLWSNEAGLVSIGRRFDKGSTIKAKHLLNS